MSFSFVRDNCVPSLRIRDSSMRSLLHILSNDCNGQPLHVHECEVKLSKFTHAPRAMKCIVIGNSWFMWRFKLVMRLKHASNLHKDTFCICAYILGKAQGACLI